MSVLSFRQRVWHVQSVRHSLELGRGIRLAWELSPHDGIFGEPAHPAALSARVLLVFGLLGKKNDSRGETRLGGSL